MKKIPQSVYASFVKEIEKTERLTFAPKVKRVLGFEELYLISDTGHVFSLRRNKIMKAHDVGRDHHLQIHLVADDGLSQFVSVHRLVAYAFVANPKHKTYVIHKDGNKRNNHAYNLMWM